MYSQSMLLHSKSQSGSYERYIGGDHEKLNQKQCGEEDL